ncbi:MAG: hypothetical protein MHMPM18_001018 [Marteilia pararefringens]
MGFEDRIKRSFQSQRHYENVRKGWSNSIVYSLCYIITPGVFLVIASVLMASRKIMKNEPFVCFINAPLDKFKEFAISTCLTNSYSILETIDSDQILARHKVHHKNYPNIILTYLLIFLGFVTLNILDRMCLRELYDSFEVIKSTVDSIYWVEETDIDERTPLREIVSANSADFEILRYRQNIVKNFTRNFLVQSHNIKYNIKSLFIVGGMTSAMFSVLSIFCLYPVLFELQTMFYCFSSFTALDKCLSTQFSTSAFCNINIAIDESNSEKNYVENNFVVKCSMSDNVLNLFLAKIALFQLVLQVCFSTLYTVRLLIKKDSCEFFLNNNYMSHQIFDYILKLQNALSLSIGKTTDLYRD